MPFTDLPAELFVRIFHYVLPDDLEAFTLTCRQTYNSAGPKLDEHEELKDKYSTLYFHPRMNKNAMIRMTRLCSKPSNTYYPKCVSFIGETSYSKWRCDPSKPGVQNLINIVVQTVPTMEYKLMMQWLLASNKRHRDPLLALCFSLLPNLESITYHPVEQESTRLQHSRTMVRRIIKSYAQENPSRALTKLSNASIYGDRSLFPLKLFGVFLMIPSMREIKGFEIRTAAGKIPLCPPSMSNVTNIRFERSQLSAKAVANVLQCVKGLKRFRYSHTQGICTPGIKQGSQRSTEGWNPQDLINTLLEHTKHTLEELSFENSCFNCRGRIVSLRDFRSLNFVTLSASLLPLQDGALVSLVNFLPPTAKYLGLKEIGSLPYPHETQITALLPEFQAWNGGTLHLIYRKLCRPSFGSQPISRRSFKVSRAWGPALEYLRVWQEADERLESLEGGEMEDRATISRG